MTSLAVDLNTVVEVLLKGSTVKDAVARGARVVNDKLVLGSSSLSGGGLGLHEERGRETSVSLLRRGLSKAVLVTDHGEG